MGSSLLTRSADAAGWVLSRGFGALASVRNARALHPTGHLVAGELHIVGTYPRTGVAALDEPGEYQVVVRTSRAIGLPEGRPDILGIAVRWPGMGEPSPEASPSGPAGPADLMFASTGTSSVTRYVLGVRQRLSAGPFSTLLPMNGPRGPMQLALFPVDSPEEGRFLFDLRYSGLTGPWRSLGSLSIDPQPLTEYHEGLRFDTIAHPLRGLPHFDWVRRLRAPSYQSSRQSSPQPG